jgi:hypothetical protein
VIDFDVASPHGIVAKRYIEQPVIIARSGARDFGKEIDVSPQVFNSQYVAQAASSFFDTCLAIIGKSARGMHLL